MRLMSQHGCFGPREAQEGSAFPATCLWMIGIAGHRRDVARCKRVVVSTHNALGLAVIASSGLGTADSKTYRSGRREAHPVNQTGVNRRKREFEAVNVGFRVEPPRFRTQPKRPVSKRRVARRADMAQLCAEPGKTEMRTDARRRRLVNQWEEKN